MFNNYLYIGPPGSGKTYKAKSKIIEVIREKELPNLKVAFPESTLNVNDLDGDANDVFALLKKDFGKVISFVSMHSGYGYSDFVEGVSATSKNGRVVFKNQKKVFLELIEEMKKYDSAGFIVLDDIDRVNISTVFGELIDAIENRNTVYTLMSGETVSVPDNLYVILTMRTMQNANKPDYGFLRRFYVERLKSNCRKLEHIINKYVDSNRTLATDQDKIQEAIDRIVGVPGQIGYYEYYNNIAKNVTYEYRDIAEDFEIGFSYFLPHRHSDINQLEILCQHKIHHQVIPLLQQYAKEGIIDKSDVPPIERTNTIYTRERKDVYEPQIEWVKDNDTWEYGRDIFSRGIQIKNNVAYNKSPGRGSLKVNRPYLMIFEIVHDMLAHNLLNESQLMDIFTEDKKIFCARRDLAFGGGGLFSENSRADIIIMRNAGDARNNYSLYNPNFHKIKYNGKTYRMISKLAGSERVPKDLDRCYASGMGGQNSNAFQGLKVLVYTYLEQFQKNLEEYIKVAKNTDKINAQNDLNQLKLDIQIVKMMTTEEAEKGKSYFIDSTPYIYTNMVNTIRRLTTWVNMVNGSLKGVYRKMDFNYKAIMDTTGIHQMILQGPPGTSKTFGAKEFLSRQMKLTDSTEVGFDKEKLQSHRLVLKDGVYSLPTVPVSTQKVYWDVIQFHPSY